VLSEVGDGELGDDVIPLAFHVDYWNYIGWSDPFSKKEWTTLQRKYAQTISKGRVYTPMLVVDGAEHVVGSHLGKVKREVEAARKRGSSVSLSITRAGEAGEPLEADVTWSEAPGADIYIAVAESGLETSVRRGENAGRALINDHIVREMVQIKPKDGERSRRVKIPADPSWNRNRLKLVAFARHRASFAVLGAASE